MGSKVIVTAVRAGSPIRKVFREEDRKWLGQPRCVRVPGASVRTDQAPPGLPGMTILCAKKGLPLQVGKFVFSPDEKPVNQRRDTMSKKYEIEDAASLESSLDDLAAAITVENLKQVGFGAGIGAAVGLGLPYLIRVLPSGGMWDHVKIFAPVVGCGIGAAFLASRYPLAATALAASGAGFTAALAMSKYVGNGPLAIDFEGSVAGAALTGLGAQGDDELNLFGGADQEYYLDGQSVLPSSEDDTLGGNVLVDENAASEFEGFGQGEEPEEFDPETGDDIDYEAAQELPFLGGLNG